MVWGDKNSRVNLRISKELRNQFDELARTSTPRMTVSEYIRKITVDYIEGERVYLLDGPPAGTEVAVVGVPELYGIDTGVGR